MALSDATRLADFGSGIGTDSTLDLNNINATGIVTATSFVGALTGNASGSSGSCTGNAAGLTGTPNITVADISSTNIVASAATITGNLTVKGTQTIINTDVLEVADVNIGIASTSSKLSNANLDGAGITIYGSDEDKTLIWDNGSGRMAFNTNFYAPKITAGSGLEIGAAGVGGTITAVGNAEFVGIVTARGGLEIGAAGVGGTITAVGNAEFVGIVSDSKGNVRNIPASTNSTLVAADAGKHISITAGITINASTDFAIGDAVTIFNNQAAGNDETITATGIDLYLATDPSVSGATNRTLAPRGVATILCVAADKYVITGGGLS